jgi:uncharacterized membrane protein
MNPSLFFNQHKFKIALGVFVAYLCLSFYNLGANSLWYDECFSIDWANDPIKDIIDYCLLTDTNPPLYLLIMHYWLQWFGDSEFALRSISALATSGACGVFFLFTLRFWNWQTAIFSTLLFFSSNELFFYAQEGRTYGLVILFCTLSNYAFMSFVKNPKWSNSFLLGLFNIIIFYLHTLGAFCVVAQVILVPFLTFNKDLFLKKNSEFVSFLGYKLKHFIFYLFSWLTFAILFLPWRERFFQILSIKGKSFWLDKPTFNDLQQCVFDFYNSKELFFVYGIIFIILFLCVLFIKKLRVSDFNYKLILIPLVFGPVLLYFNYILAVNITPIFLKRYVLFTILGFILSFAYLYSALNVSFKIKLSFFAVLFFLSVYSMKIPKESYWDFKESVEILKKVESPTCYISTDIPMLYAYYRDRKGAFKAQVGGHRDELLNKHNIFTSYGTNWPNTVDFSKYTDIYFTRTLDNYNDPTRIVEKLLRTKFVWVEDIIVKGTSISHYENTMINMDELQKIKESIRNNKEWYDQVVIKAKNFNVTVDSMISADAIWCYKLNIQNKKLGK